MRAAGLAVAAVLGGAGAPLAPPTLASAANGVGASSPGPAAATSPAPTSTGPAADAPADAPTAPTATTAIGPAADAQAVTAAQLAELMDRLSATEVEPEVDALVTAIERIPTDGAAPEVSGALPDALFLAARACEERLLEPARALALYERILARHGDARVAVAAGRRARQLREQVGQAGTSSEQAQAFAHLVAASDRLPLAEALRRADQLAEASWGGAGDVLLWSAELVRRRGATDAPDSEAKGDVVEAMRRYRLVLARHPGTPAAKLALRGLAGAAADARDWALTEALARQLAVDDAADEVTRDELLQRAATGRATARWTTRARAVLVGCAALLVASLLSLLGWRPRREHLRVLRPPLEVAYLAPVAAVMIGAALTAHAAIAPAVAIICGGGLALAWLSGAALVEARRQGRSSRARTGAHLVLGAVSALALAYLAITRTGLLDLLIATLRFGPEL